MSTSLKHNSNPPLSPHRINPRGHCYIEIQAGCVITRLYDQLPKSDRTTLGSGYMEATHVIPSYLVSFSEDHDEALFNTLIVLEVPFTDIRTGT